ncbi:hypothetical protein B0H13DRAFT_1881760 [Mycena leptocephala]|nr:hypothetical protein B0H13DRAFT_1881760 [Mycena leptocephala]
MYFVPQKVHTKGGADAGSREYGEKGFHYDRSNRIKREERGRSACPWEKDHVVGALHSLAASALKECPHLRLAVSRIGARKAQTPHSRGEQVCTPGPGPAHSILTSTGTRARTSAPEVLSGSRVNVRMRFAASVTRVARRRRRGALKLKPKPAALDDGGEDGANGVGEGEGEGEHTSRSISAPSQPLSPSRAQSGMYPQSSSWPVREARKAPLSRLSASEAGTDAGGPAGCRHKLRYRTPEWNGRRARGHTLSARRLNRNASVAR